MRRAIWIFAWFLVAIWSIAALGAYLTIDVLGTVAGADAVPKPGSFTTGEPHPFEWFFPIAAALRGFGGIAIGFTWALVTASILVGAWLLTLLERGLANAVTARPERPELARRTGRRLGRG